MSSRPYKAPRPYNAPRRAAAAAHTRERILSAAKTQFETLGWTGTTTRAIALEAEVSPKTIEASWGTKAALLSAVVDFAIRGDAEPLEVIDRPETTRLENAPTAAAMLELHAARVRQIAERSASIAWVVEHAALSDSGVAELWRRMSANRTTGVRWAARTLVSKPGVRRDLSKREIENVFWIAIDWGTYRSLTEHRGLTAPQFEAWLNRYYRRMLL